MELEKLQKIIAEVLNVDTTLGKRSPVWSVRRRWKRN